MTISHLLEDFGSQEPAEPSSTLLGEEELEDFRLSAFEQGYAAGWEDATKTQTKENQRLSAALASSLEDISFTYHEAANQMTLSLEPLFRSLLANVLPEVMSRTFGDQILAHFKEMAREQVEGPVQLTVPRGTAATVRGLLTAEMSLPIRIVEDPELDSGQAYLRIGPAEREIDTAGLIRIFTEAVDAFFYQTSKDANDG